jgi:heterogeneous nuclear ribonucleoprotein A1/A3
VRRLLEPYSKPRLVAFLAGAAAADPALLARVRAAADASLSHRRIFVHGLPPHADGPALEAAFCAFGPLSDCHVIADRASGRCRGYGFLTFLSRSAARRAVRAPCVVVAGAPVSTQFASAGPDPFGGAAAGRRVYVTNVAPDASAERLRAFFARFGELEGGPFGFDAETGRSRGYALLLYRAAEGARKALEVPYRVFEGRTLHCQLAVDPARKKRKPRQPLGSPSPASSAAPAAASPPLRPVLNAVVAAGAGDLAMYARNPAQAAALLGRNPNLAAAALSSALASAGVVLSPATVTAARSPAAFPAYWSAAATRSPAGQAVAPPLSVEVSVRPSGGAGLLGPYKPPSSPAVLRRPPPLGRNDQCWGPDGVVLVC